MFFSYQGKLYFKDEDNVTFPISKVRDKLIISSTSTITVEGIERVFEPNELKLKTRTTFIVHEAGEEPEIVAIPDEEDSVVVNEPVTQPDEVEKAEEVVEPKVELLEEPKKKNGRPATKAKVK
jgi:hypothetical protein